MGSHILSLNFARGIRHCFCHLTVTPEKSLSFFAILQGIDLFVRPFRHGILTAAPEGIAPEYAPKGQSGAAKNAPFPQCLKGVLGAGWGKSAAPGFYGRDKFPIQAYREREHRHGGTG